MSLWHKLISECSFNVALGISFREEGSKVLVHCKMGISRSASVIIAYVMKVKNWSLTKAFQYVKNKRGCIKPNENFLKQLEVYQGILNARLELTAHNRNNRCPQLALN